ncbi:hypothetical protein MVEN_02039200 [Mycena venus]|uniref:Mid2 domain-containing protein n=1 Tax=Mycena venus TaxID=2733690 RepID=A0A8H6XCC8_9AGAR|nr:hypothetical protein MVEN_02039200 [Mycena venus]
MQRALRRSPTEPPGQGPDPRCMDVATMGSPCLTFTALCSKTGPVFCCSNLMFILNGACEACEREIPDSWDTYSKTNSSHCDSSTVRSNPTSFPSTAPPVPSWALVMASATPTPSVFDFQVALDIIHNNFTASATSGDTSSSATATPSSSSAASQSSIATSSSDSTFSASPTLNPSPVPLSLASKASSTPVGAIVGGIIGALVVLALIGAGIWYIRRRRRGRHMAPSAAYKAALRAGNPSPMPYQPVYHDSPQSSTDDLTSEERPQSSSGLSPPSRPVSIHSESRFREHTTT